MTRAEAQAAIRSEPAAVAGLARVLSIAVVIEPALLRKARVQLLRHDDPGLEADLWFSRLVESRGPQGILLAPAVAEELRRDLERDPERLAAARKLILEQHANLPPALALEEEIAWLSARNDAGADGRIRERLAAAVRALVEGGAERAGLAQWAIGALARLPGKALRTEGARMLEVASRARMGARLPSMEEAPEWLSWVLPDGANRRKMGVRLLFGAIEFGYTGADAHELEMPDTDPILVEVQAGGSTSMVEIVPGEVRRVAVEGSPIRLRTADGDVYEVTPEPVFENDIFISYAYAEGDWVASFTESLLARLGERLGREIRIWKNTSSQGPVQEWLTEVDRAIRQSALFLVVVSPKYVQSEWCIRELRVFQDATRKTGMLTVGNFYRLLPVKRLPVEERGLFGDVFGWPFYRQDDPKGESLEFKPGSSEFGAAIDAVASYLSQVLEALDKTASDRVVITLDPDFDFIGGEEGARTAAYKILKAPPGKALRIVVRCEALEMADRIVKELESRTHRTPEEESRLRHTMKVQDRCKESGKIFEEALACVLHNNYFKEDVLLSLEANLAELIIGLRDTAFVYGPVLPDHTTSPQWYELAMRRSIRWFAWYEQDPKHYLIVPLAEEDTKAIAAYYEQWTNRGFSESAACHAHGLPMNALLRSLLPCIAVDHVKQFTDGAPAQDIPRLRHWLVSPSVPEKVIGTLTWEQMERLQSGPASMA